MYLQGHPKDFLEFLRRGQGVFDMQILGKKT